jgi:Tol biopolymer transport system component
MAVSPDGRLIAFSLTDGTPDLTLSSVFSIRSDGAGFAQLAEPQSNFPDFSPDGSAIAYTTGDGRVCLLQLGSLADCLPPSEGHAVAPRWSPDGLFVAFCVQTGTLCTTVVAAVDGSSSVSIMPYTNPYVDWSPDSTDLAFAQCSSSGCRLFVADTAACREHRLQCLTSLGEMGDAYRPAWSPNGRHLAFLSGDFHSNRIILLDAGCILEPTSCPRSALHLTPANGIIASLAWSPDSRQLAYVADTPTGAFLRVVQIDGSGTTEVSLAGELERGGLTELVWR